MQMSLIITCQPGFRMCFQLFKRFGDGREQIQMDFRLFLTSYNASILEAIARISMMPMLKENVIFHIQHSTLLSKMYLYCR